MLDTGKDADWFASPKIVIFAIIAVVGCVAWIIWEFTDDHPIVDLSLFKNRNFALGTLAFCLGYAIFFANVLLLPLWLQTNIGYTATWAGLVAAPSGVVAVLATPIAARFMSRVDARWLATVAFGAFAVSYFMRAGYTTYAGFWDFVMPLLVQGIAMSTFFVALLTISLDGVEPQRIPSASGISNFTRITAGGFAASITTILVGSARGVAPEPIGRSIQPLQSGDAAGGRASARFRVHRSAKLWASRAQPCATGLSPIVHRSVLDFGLAERGDDRRGVASAPVHQRQRGAYCGRLEITPPPAPTDAARATGAAMRSWAKSGPIDDAQAAHRIFGERGAAFDPVPVVAIDHARDVLDLGMVDVPADHPVEATRTGFACKCVLEIADEAGGVLHLQLQIGRERPVRHPQTAARGVERVVERKRKLIGAVAQIGEPFGVSDDAIEQIAMDHQQLASVCRPMHDFGLEFDTAKHQTAIVAQRLVVIARYVDHTRAGFDLAQNLGDDGCVQNPASTSCASGPSHRRCLRSDRAFWQSLCARKSTKAIGLAAARAQMGIR